MYHGNEKLKWLIRVLLNDINKMLARVISPSDVKEWNAFFLHSMKLDLKDPKKLNEKILWLSFNTDTRMWSRLADKYAVRAYVTKKGYPDMLIPLYGVYQDFQEIPFESLPDQFVLKATHGCDMNFICRDKNSLDKTALQKRVNFWMQHNLAWMSLELHYARIQPRILCEQYLKTKGEIVDYKFFCLNGKVSFTEVCSERSKGPYLDLFDREGKPITGALRGAENNPNGMMLPMSYNRMIEVAEGLSCGLFFVRVDLYCVDQKIYFGEMTFTPATGLLFHFNDDFLREQGEYLDISSVYVTGA